MLITLLAFAAPARGGNDDEIFVFSTVFALRYAFSNGDFGRLVGDPDAISLAMGPFQVTHGTLRVHELAFYVGSGLHF